jgi:hypothetical protein
MGPADHIRAKHEVKAFIELAGDVKEAESIIEGACARRTLQKIQKVTMTESQGCRMETMNSCRRLA